MSPIFPPVTLPRPRIPGALALVLSCLIALAGCYDPDIFKTTAISPDGHYAAIITAQDEAEIMDLAGGGPLRILTRTAGDGLAWSPDSRRLAYIDVPPNAPSSLMIMEPTAGAPVIAARGPNWKGSPVWLGDSRVAFLSHDEDNLIGLWCVDLPTTAPRPLLRRARDICRLWGSSGGERLVYQSGGELWSWNPAAQDSFPLTRDRAGAGIGDDDVALAPDGSAIAWCIRGSARNELFWQAADSTATRRSLPLPLPPGGLALTREGRVAAGQSVPRSPLEPVLNSLQAPPNRTLLWRPAAPWYLPAVSETSWNDVPLRVAGPLGPGGLAYLLNGNIILAAETARRPAAGHLRARGIEDLLALAWSLARAGYFNPARELLDSLRERVAEGSRNDYLVSTAWSQLERMQGRVRSADPWLGRAARAAVPGSPEEDAAWLERLAQAALDARDRPRANWILTKMPASLDQRPLVAWTRRLLEDYEGNADWVEIASKFRAGDDDFVAHQVYKAFEGSAPTVTAVGGVALLIGGDLEPLGDVADFGQRRLESLLGKPEFQIALLKIMQRNYKGGPSPSELGTLLLDQWVRQGDFGSARELVRTALRDSSESIPEYLEMMRRFLVIEEIDRWLQRTVTDVLLQKDIADTIAGRLNTPDDRLTLRLAQVKKALIEGEADKARAALGEAVAMEKQVNESDTAEPAFERAQAPFLVRLFTAKIAERERRWAEAAGAYESCAALMEATPGSWEVSPFDVAMMAELLRTGAVADGDLLRGYLEIMRGTGDPLVNPSHAASTIEVGLSNLATLRRVAPEAWIQPYLTYSEALFYSLMRDSWRALDLLERARSQNPPPALLERILLEEGANRDALGQHVLAARRYRLIYTAKVAPPQRASAIQAALQAELATASLASPAERLKDILQRDFLPQPWREWLAQQLGE